MWALRVTLSPNIPFQFHRKEHLNLLLISIHHIQISYLFCLIQFSSFFILIKVLSQLYIFFVLLESLLQQTPLKSPSLCAFHWILFPYCTSRVSILFCIQKLISSDNLNIFSNFSRHSFWKGNALSCLKHVLHQNWQIRSKLYTGHPLKKKESCIFYIMYDLPICNGVIDNTSLFLLENPQWSEEGEGKQGLNFLVVN